MGSVYQLLLLISCVILFHGTDGSLTKTPENVVVLRGQDAVLNCSTDSTSPTGHNPITWYYDNNIISYSPCSSQAPGFVASPPDSATDCNMRGEASNSHGISGVYKCEDQSSRPSPATRAVATVIVLEPRCDVVQPATKGLDVTLVCKMTYEWQARSRQFLQLPGLDVSLRWTDMPDSAVRITADPDKFSGTVEIRTTIDNIMMSTISSHSCKITFNFSPLTSRLQQYAVNEVSHTYTCRPTPEWHCPTSASVSPSSGPFAVGDLLTCESDGYPEPSYTWTDSDGKIVSTGPNMTLTNASFLLLNCTATGNLADTCSASATVHNTNTPVSGGGDGNSRVIIIVVVIIGFLLFIAVIIVIFVMIRRRRRSIHHKPLSDVDGETNPEMSSADLVGKARASTMGTEMDMADDGSEHDLGDGHSRLSSKGPGLYRHHGLPRSQLQEDDGSDSGQIVYADPMSRSQPGSRSIIN